MSYLVNHKVRFYPLVRITLISAFYFALIQTAAKQAISDCGSPARSSGDFQSEPPEMCEWSRIYTSFYRPPMPPIVRTLVSAPVSFATVTLPLTVISPSFSSPL